ncbi:MAG: aldolase/citrate lyase family protein [Verrucomicrobia bacterium]|nr:aldolase/citrate lyase family protein [Verrucomicrobiota bacterium]
MIAELAADSGFDWVVFDLEHGCGAEAALLPQLQAIRGSGAAAIVCVGAPHPDLIARVLDWGAADVMIPHVSTVAEAEACVQAAHYPPRGRRGFLRTVRAYGYGLRPPAEGQLPAQLIMAQIETIEAVENAREIAQMDGVDVLFVGPSDLRFDLKARPKLAKRDYAACLKQVAVAAADAGKLCGILIRDAADLPSLRKQDFDWLAVESDVAILRNGYRKLVDGFGALRP